MGAEAQGRAEEPPHGEGEGAQAELRALTEGLARELARRSEHGWTRLAPAAEAPSAALPEIQRTPERAAPEPEPRAAVLVPRPPPAPLAPREESAAVRANRARAAACAGLGELRALVAACRACGLCETRTQTVFSDGSESARVLFIGEAPGQHEDEQGVPFVGAAGQLLTDIIQKGMGLARSEVYIANVLKCRPPGNRDPGEDEKALCTPFLDRQIELVDPELIVTLGLHATRHLLRSPLSMARLRGKVHLWNGRKVVATYHPAYLLRTPADKKECWKDIQLAMRELGLTPPGAAPRATGR